MSLKSYKKSAVLLLGLMLGLGGLDSSVDATPSASAAKAYEIETDNTESVEWLDSRSYVVLSDDGKALALVSQKTVKEVWAVSPARPNSSITKLASGRILILGGADGGRAIGGGLIIDVRDGSLTVLPKEVTAARGKGHTATVLTDGRVLILGSNVSVPAELWDEHDLGASRVVKAPYIVGHRATLAADGRVYVTGGSLTNGKAAPDLVYDPGKRGFSAEDAHRLEPDDLSIAYSNPGTGRSKINVDDRLVLRFSKPVRTEDLNDKTITIMGPGGRVDADVVSVESGRLVFVKPRRDLLPSTSYVLLVSGATSQIDGEKLKLNAIDFATLALRGLVESHTPDLAQHKVDDLQARQRKRLFGCGKLTPLPCRQSATIEGGKWRPGRNNLAERWRILGPVTTAVPTAEVGSTGVRGRVLSVDGSPVPRVSISSQGRSVLTDKDGEFALVGLPAGHNELYVDGSSANQGGREYGQFVVGVSTIKGHTIELGYTMYIPVISKEDKFYIESPLARDAVLSHPELPGLQVHIPAGTVIRDRKGKVITELAIVPTPVNRAPFPTPANFPMYFTFEPGGAVVQSTEVGKSPGIRVLYPNYDGHPRGTRANFWIYDPLAGWQVYGKGRVTSDQTRFSPEAGVALHQTMGGSYSVDSGDPPADPEGPNCKDSCGSSQGGGGATAGDPIDLKTGEFFYDETDLAIGDVTPLTLSRAYRPNDPVKRDFGIGTTSNFGFKLFMEPATYGQEIVLILPNGSPVKFRSTDSVVWKQLGSNTTFDGATIQTVADVFGIGYRLKLRDGSSMQFGRYAPNPIMWKEDAFGNRTNFLYDAGLLYKVVSPSGRHITLTRDSENRISQVEDVAGRKWLYSYDENGMLTRVQYPDATFVKYDYLFSSDISPTSCPAGAPQSQCAYYRHLDMSGISPVQHGLVSAIDRRGVRIFVNEFEPMADGWIGKVSRQVLPDGSYYKFEYDHIDASSSNKGVLVTAPDGSKRRVEYDLQSPYPVSDTTAYGTPYSQTVRFERDINSKRMSARIDAEGKRTEYQYNGLGQTTRVTYNAGTPAATSVNMTYTVDGDLASVTDPLNRTTTLSYSGRCLTRITDALGRATEIVCRGTGEPLRVTDPLGNTTVYHYDGAELTAVVDPLGRATGFAYDVLGQLIVMRDPQGKVSRRGYNSDGRVNRLIDPEGNVTELEYDGNGNTTAVLLPHGNGVTYTYDNQGRLLERRDPLDQAEGWTYDAVGRVQSYTDRKLQRTVYTYDVLGRPSITTYPDGSTQTAHYDVGNRLLQLEDSVNGVLSWQYDLLGRMASAHTPEGTVQYEYDAIGRRTGMTAGNQAKVEYRYDAGDQVTRILQGNEVVEFQYDALGRRTLLTLPNGVQTGYAYDAGSQLTGVAHVRPGSPLLGDLGYAYDIAGQRIAETGSLATNLLPNASINNEFDDNSRQTRFQGNALSYDENGNLINDGQRTYIWNARNQLMEIQQGGHSIASFSYDALGRRKSKSEGQQSIRYLYDGLDVVQEAQGMALNVILTGRGIDERYARTDTNGRTYFLTDALGSTRALTDDSGAVVQRYDYTPYGQTQSSNTGFNNPYQYTGREHDDSGLYYYRARYYHPAMGRFISEDPIGLEGGRNTYAYVGGNPIRWIDPLGLQSRTNDWLANKGYNGDNGSVGGVVFVDTVNTWGTAIKNVFVDMPMCTLSCGADATIGISPNSFVQNRVEDAGFKVMEAVAKKGISDTTAACVSKTAERIGEKLAGRVTPGVNYLAAGKDVYEFGACTLKCGP